MILISLSPCPIKTLIVRAEQDEIVKKDNLKEFYETFKKQKNADVSMETISKSNHLFEGKARSFNEYDDKVY